MKQERQLRIETSEGQVCCEQILTRSEAGTWVLSLPPLLRPHQSELELLLIKVFSGKKSSPYNLALAQQLSINWCISTARKNGLTLDGYWKQH